MKSRRFSALCGALVAAVLVFQGSGLAQVRKPTGVSAITPADMKEWLTYIASDQLQGRQVYTEGLGLAASYIAEHLKAWGVKPGGDDGSYFQVVKVLGVNVKRNSTVTVTVNGQTKTFKDGEGVTFPANQGGKQTITGTAEFVGYGMSLPEQNLDDYKGKDVTGKVVDLPRRPRAVGADGDAESPARRARAQCDRTAACRGRDRSCRRRLRPRRRGARRTRAGCRRRRPPRPRPLWLPRQARRRPSPRRAADAAARTRTSGDFQTVQRLDNMIRAADHRKRRVLRLRLQRGRAELRRHQGEGRRARSAARGGAGERVDHHQGRRRLRHRPDPSHAQRRRHHSGHRSEAEGQLRDVRRALRPHRLPADAPGQGRGGGGGGGGGGAAGAAPAAGGCVGQSRDTPQAGRHHQQRRGRRRIGDGVDHGDREGVRDRAEAEALAALRVARRRRGGAARFALHGRLSGRPARQGVGAAQHRHGRPQPLRRSQGSRTPSMSWARIASAPSCTT